MRMSSESLTPREYEEYQQSKEMWELGAAHAKEMKQLDIELAKLEAKWSSWLRIPKYIILMPVYFVFGIAYIVAQKYDKELPEQYWKLFK